MYTVGRLAKKYGLSRSTLLYYDSIGLLSPSSHTKGEYRKYTEADADLLNRICMYREVGVALKDIARIIKPKNTSATAEVLERRMHELSSEIQSSKHQQKVIYTLLSGSTLPENVDATTWMSIFHKAGFNTDEMHNWHAAFERNNPNKHEQFLKTLHMPTKEIELIRSWSAAPHSVLKIKRASEKFMATYFQIYEQLDRKGPGSYKSTELALQVCATLPTIPKLLDIGCGSGSNAIDLAKISDMDITSIDIYEPFVQEARSNVIASGLDMRVKVQQADMTDLPFCAESFDIIWSEGAAYIMGFDAALEYWKQFIVPNGYLVVSEAVWLQKNNSYDIPQELLTFWQESYPAMRHSEQNILVISKLGYQLLDRFLIPLNDWDNFYNSLEKHIKHIPHAFSEQPYAKDIFALIEREIELFRKYRGYYGYEFYIMRKNDAPS